MDEEAARTRIAAGDELGVSEVLPAVRILGYRGGGVFHSVNVRAAGDEAFYVTKLPSHEAPPSHTLLVELAVARIGHLFMPSIVPPFAVLDLQQRHVGDTVCQARGCNKSLGAGYAFGSRQVADAVEYAGSGHQTIATHWATRLVAFQTWLDASFDPQIIVGAEGRPFSIDHEGYLANAAGWAPGTDVAALVRVICLSGLDAGGRLREIRLFENFLEEVDTLSEEAIVDAFAGVPRNWWSPIDVRVKLAQYVLERRKVLRQTIASFVEA